MQFPQLRMENRYAQLGLNIIKPVQEIQQPKADLQIKQVPAQLEIRQPMGELTIDTSEGQANLDLRGPLRRARDNADYGYQKVMEAIAQISQEGDQLRAIENKGNAIAAIAFEEGSIYQNSYVLDRTSGDGVEIRYEARRPEINVKFGGAQIEATPQRPIHNYKPGKVEGYVKQWNSLSIEVVGLHVDRSL
ncbi:hypothetical protein KDJ56_20050 [Brevibacillus composti]|uniref:Uncharacterized protein n=1 Tax=Brevibacillus composti TaxID=2796470 RepID=A0A7T5JN63_9BACL|nr:DUF6470 family protein [Brevibacillus composti]QQE74113.1 hypothetical protein JD108_20115 [Brevibacillus composti]QUO41197.1 hypothetical protein KDJ56_20050 [Brevibacillus composti]